MKFKEIREKILAEKEEIIINKMITIQGKDILLLSLTKEKDGNKLWTMYKSDIKREENIEEELDYTFLPQTNDNEYNEKTCPYEDFDYEETTTTNRQDLVNSIEEGKCVSHISFEEMIIQNQKITFSQSTSGSIEYFDNSEMLDVYNFIKNGLIDSKWDDVDFENIIIAKYQQNEEEDFPTINHNEKVEITLKVSEHTKEILIEHPFEVVIGKYQKDNKIYYNDEINNEKNVFYLDEIKKYDIHKDCEENLDEYSKKFEENYRKEFKAEYIESIENVCPQNMDLLTICYETKENIQLRFLTKEYLESKLSYESCSSTVMFTITENESGMNGYTKCIDYLNPIEKDFEGKIELELFSKYIIIPQENITFEI